MPVRIAARAIPAQVAGLRLEGQFFPILPHGHIHGFRTAGVHDGHDLPDDVNGILRILRNRSLFRVPRILLQKLQVHCFLIFRPVALRLLLRVGQRIGDIGEERILRPSLRNIPAVKSVAVQFAGFQIPLPHIAGGVILAIGVQRAEAFLVGQFRQVFAVVIHALLDHGAHVLLQLPAQSFVGADRERFVRAVHMRQRVIRVVDQAVRRAIEAHILKAVLSAQAVAAVLPLAVQIIEAGVFFRAKEKIGFAGKNQPEQALVAGVKPVGEKLVHLHSLLTGRSPRSGRSRGWRS